MTTGFICNPLVIVHEWLNNPSNTGFVSQPVWKLLWPIAAVLHQQLRQPLYTEQRDYTRTQKLHYTPPVSVHPARKQPPCCSALLCLPTVHMSWAWLEWAPATERHLTASAGTSGAQFCWLSPRIWRCFSFLGVCSANEKRERERDTTRCVEARNGWGESEGKTEARWRVWWKESDGQSEKDWETEMENRSGKKWVIEGDREKRVERVWNARREFNLFSGSVVPSQKCVYQPLLCH